MKWVYTIVRRWCVVVITMYGLLLGNSEPIPLSCDNCYIEFSWYKKVLDACMQAWYAAEALHMQNARHMSEDECTLYINMLMGRLSFAKFCLMQSLKYEQVMSSELNYLEQVLTHIDKQSTQLSDRCAEHQPCAQELIQTMLQALYNFN